MHTRISAIVAGVAMTLGTVAFTNPATASAATCPDNNWHTADGRIVRGIAGPTRTGPSTSCVAVGVTSPGSSIRLDCYKTDGTRIWSHVSNLDTGVRGWLAGDYANAPC